MNSYNPKHLCSLFISALFLIIVALSPNATAQESPATTRHSLSAQPVIIENSRSDDVSKSLASLPEADALIYLSPHRIIADAAPHLLTEKQLAELGEGVGQLKKSTGVDLTNVDYVVLQTRFKKPGADLSFSLPEFMIVASGDFNAAAFMEFAREAAKGKFREATHGSRTLFLMTIDDLAREAEKTPLLKSLSEVAMVPLNANTIAVGTTAYVKAAIDAQDGKGRINADLLNSVLREPSALASIAGSPLTAFAKTFALLGTENNPRASRCDSKFGDFYAGVTADATSFKLRGAMNADNPDTAKIIKSLLASLVQQANGMTSDKNAQSVLSSLVITPTETEVLVQADISNQSIADFIREQTKPAKVEETAPPPPVKHTTKRRHRATRRRG